MKNVLVDTGAWYAYMDKDDPDHELVSDGWGINLFY